MPCFDITKKDVNGEERQKLAEIQRQSLAKYGDKLMELLAVAMPYYPQNRMKQWEVIDGAVTQDSDMGEYLSKAYLGELMRICE